MWYNKAVELHNKIREMTEQSSGGTLVFFGSGEICEKMLDYFRKNEFPFPTAICDNSTKKHGTTIEEIPIISFENAVENYKDLNILVTSYEYGNEIAKQVLEKLEKNRVLNIRPYFDDEPHTEFEKTHKEFIEKRNLYTASLRGDNDKKFKLLKPTDMPEEVKEIVKRLEYYRNTYEQGEDLEITKDNLWIIQKKRVNFWEDFSEFDKKNYSLIDFLNKDNYNNVFKSKHYGNHLFGNHTNISVNIAEAVENVTAFSDFLKKKNIPFLYMQFPSKLSNVDISLINDIVDKVNPGITEFLQGIFENGVNILDYRKLMSNNNIEFLDGFFKTDHHWKPRTAFHATKKLCEELEKLINHKFDYTKFDLNNYNQIIYPNIFLGSYGRKTGILYGGLDDFEIILPKYETDYTWESPSKGFKTRGEANDSLLYTLQLDWKYFLTNPYGVYNLMDSLNVIITNHKNNSDLKILCLHDSFANPIASFLAPHFSELHFYDLRGELNKYDIIKTIDDVKPDVVIMMYTRSFMHQHCMTDVNPY